MPANSRLLNLNWRWIISSLLCVAALLFVTLRGAPKTTLCIATTQSQQPCIALEEVTTPSAQGKGLSGREGLPQGQGMLFTFDTPDTHCFWMKDMKFSLDIIWLDVNKRVIKLLPNISPATYPNSFCPTQPSKYVIELGAGQAAKVGITVGGMLDTHQ